MSTFPECFEQQSVCVRMFWSRIDNQSPVIFYSRPARRKEKNERLQCYVVGLRIRQSKTAISVLVMIVGMGLGCSESRTCHCRSARCGVQLCDTRASIRKTHGVHQYADRQYLGWLVERCRQRRWIRQSCRFALHGRTGQHHRRHVQHRYRTDVQL